MKPPIKVFFVICWVAHGNVFFKRDLEITADGTCTAPSLTNYCRMETVNVACELNLRHSLADCRIYCITFGLIPLNLSYSTAKSTMFRIPVVV